MESTWPNPRSPAFHVLDPPAMPGVCIGTVARATPAEGLWVALADEAPVPALTTVPVTPGDEGRRIVLVFEDGDPTRPIITGFIQEQPVTLPVPRPAAARLDGREVQLEAEREIVLRCGESSITLRADGKVVIKGKEIISRARRTNKVKGGTVRIN